MNVKRIGLLAGVLALVAAATAFGQSEDRNAYGQSESRNAYGQTGGRSAYSYIRDISGEVSVDSRWNGQVDARRNMPISAGDTLTTGDSGRVEIGLADGNVLHVGGGTQVRFARLRDQQ